MMDRMPLRNVLTIDVEDYFQVSAFASRIARDAWEWLPCRVERNVDLILSILDDHHAHATCFVLGWIAEHYPGMVQRIVEQGHELASHGYAHERASAQSRDAFVRDITRSKRVLEDVGGVAVQGYRAPSFSIGRENLWTMECLRQAGYRYSSSIYPIRHDHYGMPEAPRFAFHHDGEEEVLELPITTVRLFDHNLPAGGGGYFRLLPYRVSRWCLEYVNEIEQQPCIFYFHPWEIDPGQPRVRGISAKTRFRHYLNLGSMEKRIRALCTHFTWDRIDRVFFGDTRETARA